MNTWIIIGVTAAFTLALLFTAWCAIELRTKLDQATLQLFSERKHRRDIEERLSRTEHRVADFVAKVSPLIAKTDWMTGRWHGQFQTLVHLENKRNAAVDTARRALGDIPMIKKNPLNPTPYTPKDTDQ
jgi:chromosome segregation ATPase